MRILAFLLLAAAASPLAAAQRNYSVTDFTRIRVEGPFAVTLATNVAPFARASGSQRALDRVSLRVEGRTLVIRTDRSAWGGAADEDAGPVTIAVGTHDLDQATLSGPGSLAIDRVRGLDFALVLVRIGRGQHRRRRGRPAAHLRAGVGLDAGRGRDQAVRRHAQRPRADRRLGARPPRTPR